MKKTLRYIGISSLLLALLYQANAFGYYIVLDDDGSTSEFAAPKIEDSPGVKPEQAKKVTPPSADSLDKLPQINSLANSHPAAASKNDHKKIKTLKRRLASRCPAELSCGGGDMVPVNYSIEFLRGRSNIGHENLKRLSALIPRMSNTKICIIGRPDLIENTNGYVSKLALSRAYSIRSFLLKNGVKASTITVSTRSDGYTENDGKTFASDVILIEKKDNIVKQKINMSRVDVNRYIKNVSDVNSSTLRAENAKLSVIDSTNETIDFVDVSVAKGHITVGTGNNLKSMLRFNKIRVLKHLSVGRNI